jgi:hypothetical protein
MSDRYIMFCGNHIDPYIHPDHPVTRAEAVDLIVSGENMSDLQSIVSFGVGRESRVVTHSIVNEAIERLADSGEPLSFCQYEFIELWRGTIFANQFALEDA